MHSLFIQLLKIFLNMALVAWLVATATFFLMRAIPGGPFSAERQLPPALRATLEARYQLNQPVVKQYLNYLRDAASGRFGLSYNEQGRTVGEIIAQRLPVSMALGLTSMVLAGLIAMPLGIFAALRRRGVADRLNAVIASAGVAVPSFILAALLLYCFAFKFRFFPPGGWGSPLRAVLPAIALAALPTAYLARLLRGELREVLRSEFLQTARAKGLPESQVIMRHALRHTLGPVLAWLGPQLAGVMTGSFVVERIFSIPGLGQSFVNSISNRDYPLIMGVTLVYTVLLVGLNLLMDLLTRLADPRLRA